MLCKLVLVMKVKLVLDVVLFDVVYVLVFGEGKCGENGYFGYFLW